MKKIFSIALAVMASALFNTAWAAKKKKKDAARQCVEAPVKLNTSSDTLSYVAGMTMTDGLLPYLKQTQGVDTADIADFIRGFRDVINAGNDPKMKAYAAGMDIANRLKGQMLTGMKNEFQDSPDTVIDSLVFRGFVDALNNYTTLFRQKDAVNVFTAKREADKKAKDEKLYGENRKAGEAFLAENSKQEGVVTLPSGLQYKVLVKGEGEVPQRTDKVLVNYEGRLVDGTVFDSSSKHGDTPASFRADQVIKGWTEALTMMPVGSKWQLFIPQQLAYGERNAGSIKPYSTLIFDVELVGIDKPQAAEAEEKPETKAKPAKPARKPAAKK
ncbi:MAG: FKBP-type peptidyl-prolyl cis-trans isomerase [Prevotella sp.]